MSIETKYATIDRDELKRLQADSAELARLREPMSSDEIHNIAFEIARTDDGGGYYFEAEDLDKFVAEIRPIPEGFVLVPVEVQKDAERWQALINCARIKFFGWAGYTNPDPNGNDPKNYRHFGGEFWTIHDAPTSDKEQARRILNGFAEAAMLAAQGDSHE